MILVSGAAGKTGMAVIRSLLRHRQEVRAFVRSAQQKAQVERLGIAEALIGDLTRPEDLTQAVSGVRKVLHICPNVHPAEVEIGAGMIAAAKRSGIEHFVYHSVMHPQIEAMPHHWQKLRVEEMLIESGLPFTIVQPASYMQNLPLDTIRTEGQLSVPYDLRTRHSLVDLSDIALVYARVLTEPGHHYAVYELAGPQLLDQFQIAAIMTKVFGKPIEAVRERVEDWRQRAQTSGLSPYAVDMLVKMFAHYDQHGFIGNPNVLKHLLPATPTTLEAWLKDAV